MILLFPLAAMAYTEHSGTTVPIYDGYMNSYTVADRPYLYTATSNYLNEPVISGLRVNMGPMAAAVGPLRALFAVATSRVKTQMSTAPT